MSSLIAAVFFIMQQLGMKPNRPAFVMSLLIGLSVTEGFVYYSAYKGKSDKPDEPLPGQDERPFSPEDSSTIAAIATVVQMTGDRVVREVIYANCERFSQLTEDVTEMTQGGFDSLHVEIGKQFAELHPGSAIAPPPLPELPGENGAIRRAVFVNGRRMVRDVWDEDTN